MTAFEMDVFLFSSTFIRSKVCRERDESQLQLQNGFAVIPRGDRPIDLVGFASHGPRSEAVNRSVWPSVNYR